VSILKKFLYIEYDYSNTYSNDFLLFIYNFNFLHIQEINEYLDNSNKLFLIILDSNSLFYNFFGEFYIFSEIYVDSDFIIDCSYILTFKYNKEEFKILIEPYEYKKIMNFIRNTNYSPYSLFSI
jgi:hypothetical protein